MVEATEYSKTSVHFYLRDTITSRKQLPQQNYPRKQISHIPLEGKTELLEHSLTDRRVLMKLTCFVCCPACALYIHLVQQLPVPYEM